MDELSRRSFLRAASAALGGLGLTLEWPAIVAAADDAHHAKHGTDERQLSYLTRAEQAVVEAVAAQIIPTDSTPGAREAGVAFFIDRALASFLSRMAPSFRAELTQFQDACRTSHPAAESFAALTSEQQIAFLTSMEKTPFFRDMRMLTVLGMFAMPEYGGNRDGLGWKLLGFEDRHVFEPPFGYYDRDYPGFTLPPESAA
ncbi:MAG: gluconate 2-dehydrogenase subunit 3 family protein [Steroidobacter sp.]